MTVMRNHPGKIALVVIVFAAGYFVFNKENVSGYTIPFISVSAKDAVQTGNQALSKMTQVSKETFSAKAADFSGMLTEKAGELADNAMTAVKTEAFNLMKGVITKKVDNLAADLGVSPVQSGGSGSPASNPVSPSIKSGTPAYFTIKNSEQVAIDYIIDWKDGKSENGQVAKGESKIVSHSWSKSGEYVLQFKINSAGGTNEYQVRISIL